MVAAPWRWLGRRRFPEGFAERGTVPGPLETASQGFKIGRNDTIDTLFLNHGVAFGLKKRQEIPTLIGPVGIHLQIGPYSR